MGGGGPPRCRYRDEYLEEDMHTLLSDWMEHDTQGSEGISDDDDDDEDDNEVAAAVSANDGGSDVGPKTAPSSPNKKPSRSKSKKKKKKSWRRLQWRPKASRSMSPASASPKKEEKDAASSRSSKKKGTPPLPPRNSRTNGVVVMKSSHPSSSGASVTTMRSNDSSFVTTKSTATQKRSNRAKAGYSPAQASILESSLSVTSMGASSVKSGTPPLARIRRRKLLMRKNNTKNATISTSRRPPTSPSLPPRSPHSPLSSSSPSRSKPKSRNSNNDALNNTNTGHHRPRSPVGRSLMKDSNCDDENNVPRIPEALKLSDSNSLIMDDKDEDEDDSSDENDDDMADERTHVTVENRKYKVTKNYNDITAGERARAAREELDDAMIAREEGGDGCVPSQLAEAQRLIQTTICAGGGGDATSAVVAGCMNEQLAEMKIACNNLAATATGSPTSVAQGGFMGTSNYGGSGSSDDVDDSYCGTTSLPFEECDHYIDRVTAKVTPTRTANTTTMPNGSSRRAKDDINHINDLHCGEEDTVATLNSDVRRPGPIDIDTCSRRLTPAERRNLRAMHKLGYAHLRANEYANAIEIFAEILRGQKERHGKRSPQAAVAMHNLGVVCMRCGRYRDTVRLTDLAARIRVENLGKDHPEVAASLAQQGVALMEMEEHALALASFCEALRIRRKALEDDEKIDNKGATAIATGNQPLIVRLLNNIGCALFEMDELNESRLTFENALAMQRELMKANKNRGPAAAVADGTDNPFDVDPKDAYHTPLSIALALTNLGSIHLRMKDFDTSLVYYDEALLIQESVLGEDHKVVTNTKESIDFAILSKEKYDKKESPGIARSRQGVKIDRIAGILPYVSYEESKRIYGKVHHEIAAAIDAVSPKRCNQSLYCADDDQSY